VKGIYWRSLSAHLYRQHKSKKERIIHFYTHIPLLLTYFHMYRKFSHVTGIYTGNKQKVSKRRHSRRHKMPRQGNEPNLGPNQGQPTSVPRLRTKEKPTSVRRWGGGPARARARLGRGRAPLWHLAPPRASGAVINRGWRCGGLFG
jgi:hypothetical protein